MDTPSSIVEHQPKYKSDAWKQYTAAELGHWVHLLTTRAGHRSDKAKAMKDATDAQNYLNMLQEYVNEAKRKADALPE